MDDLEAREERLWTIDDVAAYLGVPKNTVYRWRVDGTAPPAFKVGKYLRFKRPDVEAWLNAHQDDGLDTPAAGGE
ncbi:helix-turn-helix domain-containing protein [Pengzhenrongella sp.]|jgi:excisionase family DNA binding protein|uniref:helix-turn-helix transcriptional regulator n=1 Tax=Pengzhenrongella sp. TaxID=2888820 RepID=UPI002F956F61